MSTIFNSPKTLLALLIMFLISLPWAYWGCRGSAESIYIQVESEPIIKVSPGTTVAILQLTGDDYEVNANQVANSQIYKSLDDLTNFLIISEEELTTTLESEEFADKTPGSIQFAYDIGEELRVGYVIYGSYELRAEEYSELGYAPNERYTADQPYAPNIDYGPRYSMQNWDVTIRYYLDLNIKALNVEKGQLSVDKTFTSMTQETYKSSQLPLDMDKLRTIYDGLLTDVVDQFRYQLTPHDVDEERYVFIK